MTNSERLSRNRLAIMKAEWFEVRDHPDDMPWAFDRLRDAQRFWENRGEGLIYAVNSQDGETLIAAA